MVPWWLCLCLRQWLLTVTSSSAGVSLRSEKIKGYCVKQQQYVVQTKSLKPSPQVPAEINFVRRDEILISADRIKKKMRWNLILMKDSIGRKETQRFVLVQKNTRQSSSKNWGSSPPHVCDSAAGKSLQSRNFMKLAEQIKTAATATSSRCTNIVMGLWSHDTRSAKSESCQLSIVTSHQIT